MKLLTRGTMLYDHIHEEDGCKTMSINDFRDDDDPLKEHSVVNDTTHSTVQDPIYIR